MRLIYLRLENMPGDRQQFLYALEDGKVLELWLGPKYGAFGQEPEGSAELLASTDPTKKPRYSNGVLMELNFEGGLQAE
jgi:hypothetical protein